MALLSNVFRYLNELITNTNTGPGMPNFALLASKWLFRGTAFWSAVRLFPTRRVLNRLNAKRHCSVAPHRPRAL